MIDARAASAGVEEHRAFPRTKMESVPVRSIQERPEFQARDLALVDARSVRAIEIQRADLIASIRRDPGYLQANPPMPSLKFRKPTQIRPSLLSVREGFDLY